MMKKRMYIENWVIAALLLCLWASIPAGAQSVVHQGETTILNVEQEPGDIYVWELYDDLTANFAVEVGDPSPAAYAEFVGANDQPAVNILWKEPGAYVVKVTAMDAAGCARNVRMFIMIVKHALPTAIIAAGPAVCIGEAITLTVSLTGTGPWNFTYTDGVAEWTVKVPDTSTTPPEITHNITINPGPLVTTQYWITSVTDQHGTNTVPSERTTQQINPLPAPSAIYHN